MANSCQSCTLILCSSQIFHWEGNYGRILIFRIDALPDAFRVVALSAAEMPADDLVTTIEALGDAFERVLLDEATDDLDRPITVLGWSN